MSSHDELVVDVAKRLGATCLVRGLRNAADLQYEASFDFYNHQLSPDIETIYYIVDLNISISVHPVLGSC